MALENEMKICPSCGKSTLEYVNSRHWVCGHCDFDLYNNVAAAVGLILYTEDNRVLLEKRAKEPQKGFLALPGGFIDGDESAESACVREVKEEIGLDVVSYRYIGSYYYEKKDNLMLGYICKVKKDEFALSVEVDKAEWFPLKYAQQILRYDSIGWNLLNDYLHGIYLEENKE